MSILEIRTVVVGALILLDELEGFAIIMDSLFEFRLNLIALPEIVVADYQNGMNIGLLLEN